MATSCGELKATFGSGLVCAAVQRGKAMHRESRGDDHVPVARGYVRTVCPVLHGQGKYQPPHKKHSLLLLRE